MGRHRSNVSARSSAETPSQRKHDSRTPPPSLNRAFTVALVSLRQSSTPSWAEMGPWWERVVPRNDVPTAGGAS